jgi:hypothetical protein
MGQAAEWLLWTHLTLTAPLHVFLPLRDMGIDGIVRVIGTDVAAAVQVKSRRLLADGKLHLLVRDNELRDPRAWIVAVVLDVEHAQLQDLALCVDVPTFRDLAFARHGSDSGDQASIPFPPDENSKWFPYVVPLAGIGARISEGASTREVRAEQPRLALPPGHSSDVGYRGEVRLMALLSDDSRLNTFKSFPDLEIVEYCVRHVETGGMLGIQVKAISVDSAHRTGTVKVPRSTLCATPATYVVVLAENRDDASPHEQCLLIPTLDLGDLLVEHSDELTFAWDPDSTRKDSAVAPYRCRISELTGRIAALLE